MTARIWLVVFAFAPALIFQATPIKAQPAAGVEAVVEVRLRPHATVGFGPVTIGDVADVHGANPALCQAVAALDLADPLTSRAAVEVTQRQVALRVQLAGFPAGVVEVGGAEIAEVLPGKLQVSQEDVVAAARQAVIRRLPCNPDDAEIRLAFPISVPLNVPGAKEDVSIRADLHSNAQPLGRVQVDVNIYAGGESRLAFAVQLDVRLYQRIAIASKKVEKGEHFDNLNVIFERRPADGVHDFITTPEMLANKRARQGLGAGKPLTKADLEDETAAPGQPLVKQRDAVKMVVRLAGVNVVTAGEALQDGLLGQIIKVRNVDSKQIVLARVAERGLVEIDP